MNTQPSPKVLFVIGRPQHGKSTVRKALCELLGLRGGSCSDIVYRFLASWRGTTVEQLRMIPKEILRPALVAAGDYFVGARDSLDEPKAAGCDIDETALHRVPSALIRVHFHHGARVIDGVRRRSELVHARDVLTWFGYRSLVIYVDRPGGPAIEDNTEDLRDLADEVITNDGTEEQLTGPKVREVLDKYFTRSNQPEIVT